jgi:PAS domain S-box-containing protein
MLGAMIVKSKEQAQRIADAELLRAIIDYLPLPIFVKDEQSRFQLSNTQHGQLLQRTEDELLGNDTSIVISKEEAEASRQRDLPVLNEGRESIVRRDYDFSDGRSAYLETRKTRLFDSAGNKYVLGVNFDFTEIRQRESQLKALSDFVPVGVVEISEEGHAIFANPLALEYLNLASSSNPLQDIPCLLGEGQNDFPGEKRHFKWNFVGPGGEEKSYIVRSSGWISIPHRKDRVAIVSIGDITEVADLRRENEEIIRLNKDLAASVKRLKEAQDELLKRGRLEQLGQLTATIAHELRNPLGAVRTSAFLAERKLGDAAAPAEIQFKRITQGIERCDAIITQLLDFARTKQLELKPVDLDSWLTQLLQEEAKDLPQKVSIECVLGLKGALINCDAARLSRAVINVISNACEAMVGKPGMPLTQATEAPRLDIKTQLSTRGIEIIFTDNGPGMAAEVIARIREPLFTTKNYGTGLGIPAVEKIMEQHGGGMDVVSEAGKGSCFTLWWPAETPKSQAA